MSHHKTFKNNETPFKRIRDERRFTSSFITIMMEYYQKNNIKDYDIFEINWDDIELVEHIAKNHNDAIDYALNKITESLKEEGQEKEMNEVTNWINDGLVARCHRYVGSPKEMRNNMLKDYIRDSRNSINGSEIFKLKELEKKLKSYTQKLI